MYLLLIIYGPFKQQILLRLLAMAVAAFMQCFFNGSGLQNNKNIFIPAGSSYYTVEKEQRPGIRAAGKQTCIGTIKKSRIYERAEWIVILNDSADSLKEALRKASLVIRGKVIKANIPDETLPKTISEHDPVFRKAVIEIKEVLKGRSKNKLLVVYYASSDDVQWYQSPKLTAGQESIFLLQVGQLPKVFKSGAYTLLQRVAVQQVQQISIIKKWLR